MESYRVVRYSCTFISSTRLKFWSFNLLPSGHQFNQWRQEGNVLCPSWSQHENNIECYSCCWLTDVESSVRPVSEITFIMLQKISISNKCWSFELSIHQSILKKICIFVSTKIWSSTTVFNMGDDNRKCFLSIKSSH